MKKLNRKGYMTVEIIIASVIAFSIAFFLMEITFKLVDVTDNEYANTNFITDKALIMKNLKSNIKKDIGDYDKVEYITCSDDGTYCTISFERSGGPIEERRIVIDKENNIIKYTANLNNDTVYYSKELDSRIKIKSLKGGKEGEYIYFQIKCDNIFDNNNYDINIIIYNG